MKNPLEKLQSFAKAHPLVGWYVALIVSADFLLHLFESGIL